MSKGLGYTIEGFLALIIIFAFVLTAIPDTQTGEDWNEFQEKVMAQDISHVMSNTGHLDKMVERGEVGSIETSSNTLSDYRLDVSGSIAHLPVNERDIGFHVLEDDIEEGIETEPVSSCDGELTEIDSEHDILRSELHDTYLYLADTDPEIPGGFDGDENYDSVWVDNSTECILEDSDGPFYINDFFFWGNNTGEYYKLDNIEGTGSNVEIDVHKASQIVRIKDEAQMDDFNPDINFNTFTSDDTDLNVFDAIILRDDLEYIEEQESSLINYMEDGSMLLMADLTQNQVDNTLDFTGLRWVDMSVDENPSNARFTSYSDSERLKFLFNAHGSNVQNLNSEIGGKISSGTSSYMTDRQLLSSDGRYSSEDWNALAESMEPTGPNTGESLPSGMPVSECSGDDPIYWYDEDNHNSYQADWAEGENENADYDNNDVLSIEVDNGGYGYWRTEEMIELDTIESIGSELDCIEGSCNSYIRIFDEDNNLIRDFETSDDIYDGMLDVADLEDEFYIEIGFETASEGEIEIYEVLDPKIAHFKDSLDFPETDNVKAYTTHLGNCKGVWSVSLDINDNSEIDLDTEESIITGDTAEVDNRSYSVITDHEPINNCDRTGRCTKFIFTGENSIELVNYRKEFENTNIDRFARINYEDNYGQADRKLISSLILWLTEEPKTFGSGDRVMETTSVSGTIGEDKRIPYKLVWRWHP